MKRVGVVLILLLSFAGLADSIYLTQHTISGTPLLCNIQNLSGCNIVTTSQYSQIFGIPLSEFGVFFYGFLFILTALELVFFDKLLRRTVQIISIVGVLSSLYFISIQVFVIDALCIYCLASAVITFLILVFASMIEPIQRKQKSSSPRVQPAFSMPPTV